MSLKKVKIHGVEIYIPRNMAEGDAKTVITEYKIAIEKTRRMEESKSPVGWENEPSDDNGWKGTHPKHPKSNRGNRPYSEKIGDGEQAVYMVAAINNPLSVQTAKDSVLPTNMVKDYESVYSHRPEDREPETNWEDENYR